MNQADKLLLSLKSWPASDPVRNSITALIPRIQQERGSFRDTTEELLEKEIAAQASASNGKSEDGSAIEDEEPTPEGQDAAEKLMDDKERMEMLVRGREEIIAEIQ